MKAHNLLFIDILMYMFVVVVFYCTRNRSEESMMSHGMQQCYETMVVTNDLEL